MLKANEIEKVKLIYWQRKTIAPFTTYKTEVTKIYMSLTYM